MATNFAATRTTHNAGIKTRLIGTHARTGFPLAVSGNINADWVVGFDTGFDVIERHYFDTEAEARRAFPGRTPRLNNREPEPECKVKVADTSAGDSLSFDGLTYSTRAKRNAAVLAMSAEICDNRCARGYCRHDAARRESTKVGLSPQAISAV